MFNISTQRVEITNNLAQRTTVEEESKKRGQIKSAPIFWGNAGYGLISARFWQGGEGGMYYITLLVNKDGKIVHEVRSSA